MFHVQFCESVFKLTLRGYKVCVLCILMVFKLCPLIHKTCDCGKLGSLDASIEWLFPKTLKTGVSSMKMVLMPYLNPVYRWICLKIFLLIDIEIIYWHGKCKISYFSNKHPRDVLGFSPPIIATIFPPLPHFHLKHFKRTISCFIWCWEGERNSSNNDKTSSARKAVLCRVTWTEIHGNYGICTLGAD
jgi:hypothetical protein